MGYNICTFVVQDKLQKNFSAAARGILLTFLCLDMSQIFCFITAPCQQKSDLIPLKNINIAEEHGEKVWKVSNIIRAR